MKAVATVTTGLSAKMKSDNATFTGQRLLLPSHHHKC